MIQLPPIRIGGLSATGKTELVTLLRQEPSLEHHDITEDRRLWDIPHPEGALCLWLFADMNARARRRMAAQRIPDAMVRHHMAEQVQAIDARDAEQFARFGHAVMPPPRAVLINTGGNVLIGETLRVAKSYIPR